MAELHEQLRLAAISFARRAAYVYGRNEVTGLALTIIASETVTAAGDIPDVIGWKNGYSTLIECKTSRADFLADAKKPQRSKGTGMGNRRYFFAPKGLISVNELPSEWGLIEREGNRSHITSPASFRELDLAAHRDEKCILLSLLRRIRMREFLIIQQECAGEPQG